MIRSAITFDGTTGTFPNGAFVSLLFPRTGVYYGEYDSNISPCMLWRGLDGKLWGACKGDTWSPQLSETELLSLRWNKLVQEIWKELSPIFSFLFKKDAPNEQDQAG